jgi:uncharacterized membrane protein
VSEPVTPPPSGGGDHHATVGLDPHLAALLCYLAFWIGGLLFLLLERDNRFVRYHAAQSVVTFGALSVLSAAISAGTFVSFFVSRALFEFLLGLGQAVWLTAIILWGICLFKAFSTETFRLPLVADLADRLAGR